MMIIIIITFIIIIIIFYLCQHRNHKKKQVGRLLGYSGGALGGGAEGAMAAITGYEVTQLEMVITAT